MAFSIDSVNRKEIYRYLGYKNAVPDSSVCQMMESVLNELFKVIRPKYIYQPYICQIQGDTVYLRPEGTSDSGTCAFRSKNLTDNLMQCKKVILFAATLGLEADKLLHRYEVTNMAKASVLQACSAAAIEAYCDHVQEGIQQQALKENLYLRPRFSPGYGDLSLETQKTIFECLQCTKWLGLTLTESLLMYPTKSVTAFIGLTENKQSCHISKCSSCKNIGCEFRYENQGKIRKRTIIF